MVLFRHNFLHRRRFLPIPLYKINLPPTERDIQNKEGSKEGEGVGCTIFSGSAYFLQVFRSFLLLYTCIKVRLFALFTIGFYNCAVVKCISEERGGGTRVLQIFYPSLCLLAYKWYFLGGRFETKFHKI